VITVTFCGKKLWTFFNSIVLEQGYQNKIHRKVSFQRENALLAAIYKKRPQNELNLIKIYNFVRFLDVRGMKDGGQKDEKRTFSTNLAGENHIKSCLE
jgi:hypothetical protein